jgi:hypothetical protein
VGLPGLGHLPRLRRRPPRHGDGAWEGTDHGHPHESTDFGVSHAKAARARGEADGIKVVFEEAYSDESLSVIVCLPSLMGIERDVATDVVGIVVWSRGRN